MYFNGIYLGLNGSFIYFFMGSVHGILMVSMGFNGDILEINMAFYFNWTGIVERGDIYIYIHTTNKIIWGFDQGLMGLIFLAIYDMFPGRV